MKGLTGLSVERPIGVAVLCLAICILGYIALTRLPVDLLPEVDFPRISIITSYEGVGPEEIETLLTRPIEQAVSTIDGVTEITGESAEGLARVQLQFDWGTDLDNAVNDVRAQLDRLRASLPEDAEQPIVLKFDISATPVATIGLSGTGDPRRLRYLADERTLAHVRDRRLDVLRAVVNHDDACAALVLLVDARELFLQSLDDLDRVRARLLRDAHDDARLAVDPLLALDLLKRVGHRRDVAHVDRSPGGVR